MEWSAQRQSPAARDCPRQFAAGRAALLAAWSQLNERQKRKVEPKVRIKRSEKTHLGAHFGAHNTEKTRRLALARNTSPNEPKTENNGKQREENKPAHTDSQWHTDSHWHTDSQWQTPFWPEKTLVIVAFSLPVCRLACKLACKLLPTVRLSGASELSLGAGQTRERECLPSCLDCSLAAAGSVLFCARGKTKQLSLLARKRCSAALRGGFTALNTQTMMNRNGAPKAPSERPLIWPPFSAAFSLIFPPFSTFFPLF